MKQTIIITLALLALAAPLAHAQASFSPYGSVRTGIWYENEDEDLTGTGESRLNLNYYLQSNSRFGARFRDGVKQGRVEFGRDGGIRHLWASYDMGPYTIIIGQAETMLTQKGSQVFGSENNFVGWGAIDNSRRWQARFDLENGVSVAFVQPDDTDVIDALDYYEELDQDKVVLLPKINLGYSGAVADNINMSAALGLNMYDYDDAAGGHDEAVMSYVLGAIFDMDFNPLTLKLHANIGQNTGNYGLGAQTYNVAVWNGEEVIDVITMGGFGELGYRMNDDVLLTFGASYIMSESDHYDETDTAMAAFGQLRYQVANGFRITPEIGLQNRMQDADGNDQGSLLYLGTQLRMDF